MEWITKKEFIKSRPDITLGQFNWWRHHRKSNGFTICSRKIGKVVFVSPRLFDEWINKCGEDKYDEWVDEMCINL